MARRSEHTQEQIKEMVLSAAESILIEDGYEGLTVRKIAQEIGYTVGSIYMVFCNMQELLLHIKSRCLEQLIAELQASTDINDDKHAVIALADCYLDFARANLNRWRLVFDSGQDNSQTVPEWYQQKFEQMFEPIEEAFKRLCPTAGDEQARHAARTLWCSVHGVLVFSVHANFGFTSLENTENSVHVLIDNFVRGWQC